MATKAKFAPSMALGPALMAATGVVGVAGLVSGCATESPNVRLSDCMETSKSSFLGLFKSISSEFNETCSASQFSAQLVRTFEDAKTDDKALVAFYAMMERYFQGSDEKRVKFDKIMVRSGFDPKRVDEVSRRYGPVESGLVGSNCPEAKTPKFTTSDDGKTTTMHLGCFKVASDGKVEGAPAHQPPAVQAAPAVAVP